MKATLHKPKAKVIDQPTATAALEVGTTIARTELGPNMEVKRVEDRVWEIVEVWNGDDEMSAYRKLNNLVYLIAKWQGKDYFDQPTGRVNYCIFQGNPQRMNFWLADTTNTPKAFRLRLSHYHKNR